GAEEAGAEQAAARLDGPDTALEDQGLTAAVWGAGLQPPERRSEDVAKAPDQTAAMHLTGRTENDSADPGRFGAGVADCLPLANEVGAQGKAKRVEQGEPGIIAEVAQGLGE